MGRSRIIKSPEEFMQKAEAYVQECADSKRPVTWTGMALALGFAARESIDEYAEYDGYSDCVKRAKLLVEHAYEKRLHGNNPTGAIFALKNMRWKDTQHSENKLEAGDSLAQLLREISGKSTTQSAIDWDDNKP